MYIYIYEGWGKLKEKKTAISLIVSWIRIFCCCFYFLHLFFVMKNVFIMRKSHF